MDWNRIYLTGDHIRHDCQFSMPSSQNCTFCLQCAVIIWKDGQQLNINKQHVLTELLNQLLTNRAQIAKIINGHDRTAIHSVFALIDLVQIQDEQLTKSTIEGILQFMALIESGEVIKIILDNVIQWICEVHNYGVTYSTLQLLDQLVSRQPALIGNLITGARGEFLPFLCSTLVYTCDDIKMSVITILVHFVKQVGWQLPSFNSLASSLPSEMVKSLKNTQNRELQMKSLDLLRLMASSSTMTSKLFTVNINGSTFPLVLKRLLMSKDKQLVTDVVQCISSFLQKRRDECSTSLLSNDIPPFLFEALSTQDQVLLTSVVHCCCLLADCQEFFTGSFTIYGIDSMLQAAEISMTFQNPNSIIPAFKLLTSIFQKQPGNMPLFSNARKAEQVLMVMKMGIEHPYSKVSRAVIRSLEAFLKHNHLMSPIPFLTIKGLIESCLKTLPQSKDKAQIQNRQSKAWYTLEEQMAATLAMTNAVQRLCHEASGTPIMLGSAYKVPESGKANLPISDRDLTDLKWFIVQTVDEIFVPTVLSFHRLLRNPEVFSAFLESLSLIAEFQDRRLVKEFVTKLSSSGFLILACNGYFALEQETVIEKNDSPFEARNYFLYQNLYHLLTMDLDEAEVGSSAASIESLLKTGLRNLHRAPEEFVTIFSKFQAQPDTEFVSIRATQTVLLALCYFTYLYDQRLISVEILLPALCDHLTMSQSTLTILELKLIAFLMAVCSLEWKKMHPENYSIAIHNYREALQELVKAIQVLQPVNIYTHHPAFVEWVFSVEEVTRAIGQTTLRHFLDGTESKNESGAIKFDVNVKDSSDRLVHVLLECLTDDDSELIARAVKALQRLEFGDNLKYLVLQKLPNILAANLNNLENLEDHSLISILQLLLRCLNETAENTAPQIFGDSNHLLAVLHQVNRMIEWIYHSDRKAILPAAIQGLATLLSKFISNKDVRGITCILSNPKLLEVLEQMCSTTSDNDCDLKKNAYEILGNLNQQQLDNNLPVSRRIIIPFAAFREAMFSSAKQLSLVCLEICYLGLRRGTLNTPLLHVDSISKSDTQSSQSGRDSYDISSHDTQCTAADLSILHATFLNLLYKEHKTQLLGLIIDCLEATVHAATKMDGPLCKELVSQHWTGMAIEAIIASVELEEKFLKFIHLVLQFVTMQEHANDDLWLDIWQRIFREIIRRFEEEEKPMTPTEIGTRLKLKILQQILKFAEIAPNFCIPIHKLQDLIDSNRMISHLSVNDASTLT